MQEIFPQCPASRLGLWKAFIQNILRRKKKKKSFMLRFSIPTSASKRDINIPKAGKRLSNGNPQLDSYFHTELSASSERTQEQLLFAGKWYLNNSLFFSRILRCRILQLIAKMFLFFYLFFCFYSLQDVNLLLLMKVLQTTVCFCDYQKYNCETRDKWSQKPGGWFPVIGLEGNQSPWQAQGQA